MEEEMSSMVSKGGMNVISEASDSNSCSYPLHTSKRLRHCNNTSSVKFKGLVPQQNGHWGAQIYANHQRIWLGTFKSEKEAAMAYDSAAIKLRNGDSHRNFPWTSLTIQEPSFQNLYSTETVLNMIKDGSYPSKFSDFLRTHCHSVETEVGLNSMRLQENKGFFCRQLFQKELTPSDVGKLNRLVIPKKYAVKYFPPISEEENEDGGNVDDIELVFCDRLMRSWKFRYCYWKSSQSYVFTRGWNRFAKENELKAKDVITFYKCEYGEGEKEAQTFCMIDVDVGYDKGESNGGLVAGPNQNVGMQVELRLGLGQKIDYDKEEFQVEKQLMEVQPTPPQNTDNNGFRLFGVQIS